MRVTIKMAVVGIVILVLIGSFLWINGILLNKQPSTDQQDTEGTEDLNMPDLTADHLEGALQELEQVDFNAQ